MRDFFGAFTELDAAKAADAVCEAYRDDVNVGLEMLFGFVAMGGQGAKIEVVGLKLEVTDKGDNQAVIATTSGKIKVTLQNEVQEEDIKGAEAITVIKEDGKWVMCDESMVQSFRP